MTFDEFLDTELTGLRRYAVVLVGDRQRAHDVLADALLAAHLGWDRIGEMDFPTAYVRRMVTSTFLSEKRRWSVRMIRPTRSGEVPDTPLADPTGGVDDREHLHQLLAGLPRRQRAAAVLRYYLDLPDAEIATELGITAGAVRTAISRALASLRITARDMERDVHDEAAADIAPTPGPDDEGGTDAEPDSVNQSVRVPGPDDVSTARPRPQEGR